MGFPVRSWAVAASMLGHVGLIVSMLYRFEPDVAGAQAAGLGGVEISLGPAGAAPGGEAKPVTPDVPEAETVAAAEAAEITPEIVDQAVEPPADAPVEAVAETVVAEALPPEPARPIEPESVEPEAVETPAQPVEAEPVEAVEPEAVQTLAQPLELAQPVEADPIDAVELAEAVPPPPPPAEVDEVEPAEADRVKLAEADEVKPAEAAAVTEMVEAPVTELIERTPPKPRQKPRPPEPPRQVAEPVQPPEPPAEQPADQPKAPLRTAAAPPGAGGEAGTTDAPEVGSGKAKSGGGLPGASADYMAALRAWLERHKQYPRRAQIRRQEGTALLRFVMNREGQVVSYRIERSSGYAALDREVEAMLRRAQPLPPLPEAMRQARLELVVPVQFFLR